tara:strand:- start:2519 stop:3088 length:570 start_codon:yes stop_codon:yes gene_type:complete
MTEKKKSDSPRKLFVDRMRRENRFNEYREGYRKYMADGMPFLKAQFQTMTDMGYEGPEHERAILAAKKEDARRLLDQDVDKLLKEYDINDSDLPIEIAFVFHNLHKTRGERHQWGVAPPESPTPGAWNMLVWATENEGKFMELVIREQLKGKGKQGEDQGMGDTGESIMQLEAMLSNAMMPDDPLSPST